MKTVRVWVVLLIEGWGYGEYRDIADVFYSLKSAEKYVEQRQKDDSDENRYTIIERKVK